MNIYIYIFIMAVVTYLVRMLPMVIFRTKIKSNFIKSFLYYVPYTVLAAMTVPAVFYSTGSFISAIVGFVVAIILSYFEKPLLTVAISACLAVYFVQCVESLFVF